VWINERRYEITTEQSACLFDQLTAMSFFHKRRHVVRCRAIFPTSQSRCRLHLQRCRRPDLALENVMAYDASPTRIIVTLAATCRLPEAVGSLVPNRLRPHPSDPLFMVGRIAAAESGMQRPRQAILYSYLIAVGPRLRNRENGIFGLPVRVPSAWENRGGKTAES
jgi:hypothetical protein